MTIKPSSALLLQVIFQPQDVAQSAWIVSVNFILYVMASKESGMRELAKSFRHNVRLALDDANIYLSPSEANIQTLLLLASHGDEFASPHLSWMLLGHACRQAQALGLHTMNCADDTVQQRRLSLFWALFMVDKSCSIAFGRPCFLPNSVYGDTNLPNEEHMHKYKPHLDVAQLLGRSSFGAHFFAQSIELAKLSDEIMDPCSSHYKIESTTNLKTRLDACYQYSYHVS